MDPEINSGENEPKEDTNVRPSKNRLYIIIAFAVVLLVAVVWAYLSFTSRNAKQTANTPTPTINTTSSDSFSFAAVGDFGAQTDFKATLSTIKKFNLDFTLGLGDFSYGEVANEVAWCNLVKNQLGADYSFELVAGNHDTGEYGNQGYIQAFSKCLPNKIQGAKGKYGAKYYFDYKGLARFILISPDIKIGNKTYEYTKGTNEYAWLKQSIEDAHAKGINWLIVGMHKNCITIGVKKCEIGNDITNLLVKEKVSVILQGHEHGYMRSKQLTINSSCPLLTPTSYKTACVVDASSQNAYSADAGTVLIINGSGGYKLRDINLNRPEKPFFATWNGANIKPAHGPTLISINKDALTATFEGNDGKAYDTFTLKR